MSGTVPGFGEALIRELELPRLGSFGLRMRVWWSRDRLTRELAAGAASVDSRELALRAGQITARRTREVVAASIDDLMDQAERPPVFSAQVPLDRTKLCVLKSQFAELAERLRSAEPVTPRGMALILILLTDPERPLHGIASAAELRGAIIDVRQQLDAPFEDAW